MNECGMGRPGCTLVPMQVDVARVVNAVSPKVALRRLSAGVEMSVEDILGEHKATIYDGSESNSRITSLNATEIASSTVVNVVGIPDYISDFTDYSDYNLTESGWYIFVRITAPDGATITESPTVTGASGYIFDPDGKYIDVAVRFGATPESQKVTILWGDVSDVFIFKATDLAIRNIDYRTTFYLYDLDEYVVWTYSLTTDTTFAENKAYFTEQDGVYTLAEVTAGEEIPENTYYQHSKVRFEGMTRNVTYKFDTMIDCPIEIVLPEVDDEGYGAWFEIQLRYNASYSVTLLPPEGVKIGTVSTQAQTAGINVIDLQYTGVGGVKMWSLLNTHSNIPS